LARTTLQRGSKKILFLSREGYLLHKLYQRMQAHVPALAGVEGRYLLASRRGMNTPAMHELADLATVFRKPYTGSLFCLLDSRLGRDVAEAAQHALEAAEMQSEVYLPEMAGELIERLRSIAPMLKEVAQRERTAYRLYWHTQVSDDDQPIVADIGYVGSIQSQLARVVDQPSGGAYFAVTAEIDEVLGTDQWAVARFHDGRHDSDEAPVLTYHLLLDSLLTSPSGQFSHFEQHGTDLVPCYHEDDEHAQRWALIEKIQAGVEQFIEDMLDVAGRHVLDAYTDPRAVQEPLRAVGTGRWQLGAWSKSLVIDDGYTGRGHVATTPNFA
jgi:hypothetical protein